MQWCLQARPLQGATSLARQEQSATSACNMSTRVRLGACVFERARLDHGRERYRATDNGVSEKGGVHHSRPRPKVPVRDWSQSHDVRAGTNVILMVLVIGRFPNFLTWRPSAAHSWRSPKRESDRAKKRFGPAGVSDVCTDLLPVLQSQCRLPPRSAVSSRNFRLAHLTIPVPTRSVS